MTDSLTAEAVYLVEQIIRGVPRGEDRAARLRQIIAVAAGQLTVIEGSAHARRVCESVGSAVDRRAA